jgi:hypothetical protein
MPCLTQFFPVVQAKMALSSYAKYLQENEILEINLVSAGDNLHIFWIVQK